MFEGILNKSRHVYYIFRQRESGVNKNWTQLFFPTKYFHEPGDESVEGDLVNYVSGLRGASTCGDVIGKSSLNIGSSSSLRTATRT